MKLHLCNHIKHCKASFARVKEDRCPHEVPHEPMGNFTGEIPNCHMVASKCKDSREMCICVPIDILVKRELGKKE